jgi:hypothetical protein
MYCLKITFNNKRKRCMQKPTLWTYSGSYMVYLVFYGNNDDFYVTRSDFKKHKSLFATRKNVKSENTNK